MQSASIGDGDQPPIFLYSDPGAAARAPGRDAWDRGRPRHGGGRGMGGGSGAGHRPLRRAANRRDHSTRCGPAPPTRRSVRPSAWRCSAACSTSSTATCPTARSTHRCGACSASSRSTPPSGARPLRGVRCVWRSRWPRRARRPCRRCEAGWAQWPTTFWRSSSSTAASCAATPRCRASWSTRERSGASSSARARSSTAPIVVSNLDPTATFTQSARPRGSPRGVRPPGRGHRPPGRLLPGALRPATGCPSTASPMRRSTARPSAAT